MKAQTLLFLFFYWLQPFSGHTQSSDLPFTISMEEVTHTNWPGLHSFAFAKWNGYWIIVAGRSNGLHGFFPFTGFPEQTANNQIWLLDPLNGNIWQRGLEDLEVPIAAALQSSNPQYIQQEEKLYVFGGYGKDPATDEFITFSQLTVFDLPILVDALLNGNSIVAAVHSIEDERMRVCGGETHQLGEWSYLVGGHDFSGLYSQSGTPAFIQTYTSEVRKFKLSTTTEGNPQINDYTAFSDPEFHRRDLSLAPCILNNGEEGLCAYGGVFQPDADLPYLHPIYISENEIDVNFDYEQLMSQYTCPVLPVYDAEQDAMHSVFFGGLSYHTFDTETQTFEQDELIPFISSITLMSRFADGGVQETVLSTAFDELLGTNAKWVFQHDTPLFSDGVIDLNAITEARPVGYVYGGIKAVIPNITPSSASNRLFKIWLHPKTTTSQNETLVKREMAAVYPNPFSGITHLQWLEFAPKSNALLTDALGRTLMDVKAATPAAIKEETELILAYLPAGYYQLWLHTNEWQQRISVLKI